MSTIIRTISRKLFPFILLYGLYIITYGHLSPGGGFQGGVVLASGIILLCLSQGVLETRRSITYELCGFLEVGGIFIFIMLGVIAILLGYSFLTNVLSLGEAGGTFSGGQILWLNLAIGLKVGGGISTLFYVMAGFRGINGDR